MQRHRNQQIERHAIDIAAHVARDQPRDARTAAIFELEDDVARHIAIGNRRKDAVMSRRGGEACGARQTVGARRAAAGAPRPGQKLEPGPACRTQIRILDHDLAACGAARRQRKAEHGIEGAGDASHRPVLVVARGTRHKPRAMSAEIFDRNRRRAQRARTLRAAAADRWLLDTIAAELADRLTAMTPDFSNILMIGPLPPSLDSVLRRGGAQLTHFDLTGPADETGEEDQLPFREPRFDCVIAMPGLETVNDLPGALILAQRALLPNGLLLGAILGAGTLSTLKRCFLDAEQRVPGGVAARFHPQIDVRAAGDLLQRAGLSQPVADQERIVARYAAMERLVGDVRANGLGNCLAPAPLARGVAEEAARVFAAAADRDGKTAEFFCPIYLTGWAPVAGEARPAGPTKQRLQVPE